MHTSTTQKHASAGKEVIDDSVERTNPSKLLNDPPTNNCFEDDRDRVQTLKAASLPSSQSPDAEPKFPVSCPVIREGFGGTEYAVANTIVTETYRNDKQNTGELLYVLDSGRTCTEKDLQFGIHTPVWFHAENGDYVVATVLSVTFHPTVPGKEPSYCIQELESKQVYLDVSGQFLHYRHAEEDDYYYELQEQREGLCNYYTNDGTTNQEYAVADKGSSEQETHEKQQRDAANNGMSSQHPAIANLRGYSELWDETGQDDHRQFDKECRGTANQDHTTNATANLSSSELETEKKCSTLFEKSDGKAIAHEIDEDRKKHFLVPLPEEIADSTKRPKHTHHFLLRIPNWTPLESVTGK